MKFLGFPWFPVPTPGPPPPATTIGTPEVHIGASLAYYEAFLPIREQTKVSSNSIHTSFIYFFLKKNCLSCRFSGD